MYTKSIYGSFSSSVPEIPIPSIDIFLTSEMSYRHTVVITLESETFAIVVN